MTERLEALNKLGFRLALDEFGSGSSSIAHLVDYPFEQLKLSAEVIAQLEVSTEGQTVVSKLVEMATTLNKGVTALGVDSREKAERLSAVGCTGLQGDYIGVIQSFEGVDLQEMQWHAAYEVSQVA